MEALCQRLTRERPYARVERDVSYGGNCEKTFARQEWHDGSCDPNAMAIVQTPTPHFTPGTPPWPRRGYRPRRRSGRATAGTGGTRLGKALVGVAAGVRRRS